MRGGKKNENIFYAAGERQQFELYRTCLKSDAHGHRVRIGQWRFNDVHLRQHLAYYCFESVELIAVVVVVVVKDLGQVGTCRVNHFLGPDRALEVDVSERVDV